MPVSDGAVGATVRQVERCCAAHTEVLPLRIAVTEELRAAVPFDAHVWAITDPVTEVGVSPYALVPDEVYPRLPTLIRTRYLTEVNRPTHLAAPVATLVAATDGEPRRSLLYREALESLGVTDVATMVLRDRHACWGWIDLWRIGGPPFSPQDVEVLTATVPAIAEALRQCIGRSFDEPAPPIVRTGPAVLFLSPELEVLGQTPETDGYLRTLLPPDTDRRPVPAGAYNVSAQLLACEAGVDDRPPVARVHLVGGIWLTFRAARVEGDAPEAERNIAVTIEPTSPSERRMLYARSHGLSAREIELLDLLADGADTRTIADAMFVSEHTVQDHLKSIFAKTGARNRRTLVSRVSAG